MVTFFFLTWETVNVVKVQMDRIMCIFLELTACSFGQTQGPFWMDQLQFCDFFSLLFFIEY